MENGKGPLSWLKRLLGKSEDGNGKKFSYLLLIFLLGTGIMIGSNFLSSESSVQTTVPASSNSFVKKEEVETFGQRNSSNDDVIGEYEKHYEMQLKEALEKIAGVSDVTVVVNLDSTDQQIFEKNRVKKIQKTEEKDREGGERTIEDFSEEDQIVIIRDGEKEIPIIQETKKPKVRGVLVVAKGANNVQVKKWIVESVTRLLDVPSHRVSVMPKK